VDGSGLSIVDRLTPAALTAVLRLIVAGAAPPGGTGAPAGSGPGLAALRDLVPGLPVAGYDGTLGDRYRSGPQRAAAGTIRAKTGSLTGVASLAGVVGDHDGRLLLFAFMADRLPPGGLGPAELALDAAAAVLARCGCR
jgi:serine-type D-Ala-D-Ala carboxypeptidase/endopeptidase (penicillin-binding protein 4)